MSIDADDLIKAFEALDLMNGQYAESFSNMAGNRSMEIESAINSKTIDTKPIVHAQRQKSMKRSLDLSTRTVRGLDKG